MLRLTGLFAVFNGSESHCIRAAQFVFCALVTCRGSKEVRKYVISGVTCRGSKEVRKYVISGVVNNLVTQ